ncbi:hypothetical protein B4145_3047 [Bacillus subtilis]|uniref:Uncharacterized protein n=1 Tax=Bacillus subtilis subsp. subtilis TaxID=135461 RepID=A0ABD4A119_BACIU|nr:hypothetical protein B4067_3158 [Bacillus subtilis subsp. subtilis]KIN51741.1 hypothetical protein B4145_3047 [Bacillus subtilis]
MRSSYHASYLYSFQAFILFKCINTCEQKQEMKGFIRQKKAAGQIPAAFSGLKPRASL